MDSFRVKRYYTTIRSFLLGKKNKEFLIFLLFFLISTVFWLLQSLNETYEVELDIPLKLTEVPSDVVITAGLPSHLTATVRDKGTVLTRYLYGVDQTPVLVDYRDYDKGMASGSVTVDLSDIQDKIQSQLFSSTRMLSFRPDTLEYFFNRGARKKIPVRMAGILETSPEYYLRKISFYPDSVEVLAPYSILDTISEIRVVPFHLTDLEENREIRRSLQHMRGAKFIPAQVSMTVEVDMYTEKTVEVPVLGVNFPPTKGLRTFPSTVDVTFRVGMSRFKELSGDDFVLAVNYEELMKENPTKIKLRITSLPEGVSNVRIEPTEVDYLIEQIQEEREGE